MRCSGPFSLDGLGCLFELCWVFSFLLSFSPDSAVCVCLFLRLSSFAVLYLDVSRFSWIFLDLFLACRICCAFLFGQGFGRLLRSAHRGIQGLGGSGERKSRGITVSVAMFVGQDVFILSYR